MITSEHGLGRRKPRHQAGFSFDDSRLAIVITLLTTLPGLLIALLTALAWLLILLTGLLARLLIALLLATLARLVLVLLLVGIVHLDNSKGDIALQPLRVLLPLQRHMGCETRFTSLLFCRRRH